MPNSVREEAHELLSFGKFRVNARERWIERAGSRLELGNKAFDVLLVLIERPGEVVPKNDLLDRVWHDVLVDDVSLRVQIAALRKALGDGKSRSNVIANVQGKGYAFLPIVSKARVPRRSQADRLNRSNVPALPSRMVGREGELPAIKNLLSKGRFVTIAGPGGIGKTTLAISVANALSSEFGRDIRYVSFSALTDAELVVGSVASSFNVRSGVDDPVLPLVKHLRQRRMLIVLDCCEHLVEAVATLTERLMRDAPNVHLLATSREPLRSTGEQVHRLFPLDIPPKEAGSSAAAARGFPVVELFVERAVAISDRFVLDDKMSPAVVEICRRLDGIPLAVELAAARAGVFGVLAVHEGLNDVLSLLTDGRRTIPRHQTLRAALDWSYQLLSPLEQAVMQRLSLFRGSFTLNSGVTISAFDGVSATDARDAIGNLVSKSLLTADHGREPMRYRFLDTTRTYAVQQLTHSGALFDVHRRLAIHCVEAMERSEADWGEETRDKWIDDYAVMIDDIRSVQDWAFSIGGDAILGIRVTVASAPLLFGLLLMEEFCGRAEQALEFVNKLGLENSDVEMKLRLAQGVAIFNARGSTPVMASAPARALEIAEKINDSTFQLRALWQLARERSTQADYRGALQYCVQFDRIAEQSTDLRMRIIRDRMMALGLFFVGRHSEALVFAERAVAYPGSFQHSTHMSFNEYDHRVAARSHLARILWPLGFARRAADVAAEGVEQALAVGYPPNSCYVLAFAAIPVAFWSGNTAEAQRYINLLRENTADLPHGYWHSWLQLFEQMHECRRRPSQDQAARESEMIASSVKSPFIADTIATFGESFITDGAVERVVTGETGWSAPEVLRSLGCRAVKAGESEKAERLFLRSIDVAREQSATAWELRAVMGLAELQIGDGRIAEAIALLNPVYRKLGAADCTEDLRKARRTLEELDRKQLRMGVIDARQ
jgi:predicted ATPase/DNA-binding winged helix-turn-helix (wHTH) protein